MTYAFCLVSFFFLVITSRTTLPSSHLHDHEHVSFYGFQLVFRSLLQFCLSFWSMDGGGGVSTINYTSQCLVTAKQIRTHYCFTTEIVTLGRGGCTTEPSSSVNRCSFSLEITPLLCNCTIRTIVFCFVLHEITGQCYRILTTINPLLICRLLSFYKHSASTG